MRVALSVVLAALAFASASPAGARSRVAISELQIEGAAAPALGLQLQDGFVLGLVRAGVHVIDPADMTKRLEGHPELQRCDTSPCLKEVGRLLEVGYVVRVRVEVAGNSYKAVGRLFSTQGAAPAVLPIATASKSCDVCTVAEAREVMLRLADELRRHIEDPPSANLATPTGPTAPSPPRLLGPIVLAMAGALAIGAGFAVLASNGDCTASDCDENRTRNRVGGALLGAGVALTFAGGYVTIVRSRGGDPVTGVTVAFRW